MKFSIKALSVSIFVAFAGVSSQAEETWFCPDGDMVRAGFDSGELQKMPDYYESHGARVQRQHPQTQLIGQSKFIEVDGRIVAACQYYNHIGLTAGFMVFDTPKGDVLEGSYWRQEYIESNPSQDVPGAEMMDVCFADINGVAVPSVACGFTMPANRNQ